MSSHLIKKVLITGGTGFIGQHLLEEFEDAGAEVTLMTRKANPVFRSKINVTLVEGDISNKETVVAASAGKHVIIHLAGETKNKERMIETNVHGTKNILEAAKVNRVKK